MAFLLVTEYLFISLLQTSSLHVLLQAAACRRMMGNLNEAAEVYEHGLLFLRVPPETVAYDSFDTVIKADPTHNDAKMKLAEIYEIMNEPRKALDLVMQGLSAHRVEYTLSHILSSCSAGFSSPTQSRRFRTKRRA